MDDLYEEEYGPPPVDAPTDAVLVHHVPVEVEDDDNARVGIVAYCIAKTSRGKCCACIDDAPDKVKQISANLMRYVWRQTKTSFEKGMHVGCLENRNVLRLCTTRSHMVKSARFLENLLVANTFASENEKNGCLDTHSACCARICSERYIPRNVPAPI